MDFEELSFKTTRKTTQSTIIIIIAKTERKTLIMIFFLRLGAGSSDLEKGTELSDRYLFI